MKFFTIILSPLLFIVSFLFPKNNKIWLYGAWFGKDFRDNSKNLYDFSYTINDPSIKHIWIFKDKKLASFFQSTYKGVYAYSVKGILLQLRAKVFISSVNSSDFIPFLITPSNFYVQLWHGSPMKYIGLDSRKQNSLRYYIDKLRLATIDRYSIIISPSKLYDGIFSKAFNVKEKHLFRCGYPRNDKLFVDTNQKQEIKKAHNIKDDETFFIYMPTHRNEGKSDKNNMRNVIASINEHSDILKERNIVIIIKPHFYEKDHLKGLETSENVRIIYDLQCDLYSFLGASDGLISDYSSVMFDFEITNKPILIYPFDYDEYIQKDRNLYFDLSFVYENLNQVSIVNSVQDLVDSIIKLSQFKNHSTDNIKMSKFNYSNPNNALYSKRIFDLIKEKVKA